MASNVFYMLITLKLIIFHQFEDTLPPHLTVPEPGLGLTVDAIL